MKVLNLLALLFFVSCSSLSKNAIRQGDTKFSGGVYKDETWSSDLTFKRYSWFNELTLLLDVLVADVQPFDPFHQWFSLQEKDTMKGCANFRVVMAYALDTTKLSETDFVNQAQKVGYEKVSLPHFKSYLRLHPEYDRQSFQLYDIFGLCQRRGASAELEGSKIPVALPSFPEVEIP